MAFMQPQSLGDVGSFMGLHWCYLHVIATLAKSLIKLNKKNSTFRWTEKERQAFHALKEKLTTAPILAYPPPPGPSSWTRTPLTWALAPWSSKTSTEKRGSLLMAAGS